MSLKKLKIRQIVYYIVWGIILFLLWEKFIQSDPFGKNSAFNQTGCKAKKAELPKDVIKYDGM